MESVDAKCPNCGANVKVDSKKDATICEFCGEPFVTEKGIESFKGENRNKVTPSNKANPAKISVCICGYLLDVFFITLAFLFETVGMVIILSCVAILISTCIIIKAVKKEKIKDSMIVFVGKWSCYISMFIIGIILELILLAFEVDLIGKIIDKIEK